MVNFNGILIGTGSVAPISEDVHEFLIEQNLQDKGYQLNFEKCLKNFVGGEILYSPGDFVLIEPTAGEIMVVQVESFLLGPCQNGMEPSMLRFKLFDTVPEEGQPPFETGKIEVQETTISAVTITGHLLRKLLSFDLGHGRFSLVDHLDSISMFKDALINVPFYPFVGDLVTINNNTFGKVVLVDIELRTCVVKVSSTGIEVSCDWDDLCLCDE